jgi:hypothetical protein
MRRAIAWLLAGLVLCPAAVYAHERFVKHNLKVPLHDEYFRRTPGALFGVNPNMLRIGTVVFVVLAVFTIIWFFRQRLDAFVEQVARGRLRGAPQRWLHELAAFVMDKPVRLGWFHALGEWAVILFLRSPALVLMYSATNDSLVMPSYPLEPSSATPFKFIQVVLAILILTQMFLPLSGALILGTWLYLFRWGWMVAVDALPVVTVAAVYVSSPWQSHKLAITELNHKQMRAVRLILGFGFTALGWFKLYNHNLIAGVADNYPWVMNDPMISLFSLGTDPAFRRENWIVSFGLAEVLSGFMLMTGIFTRVWCLMMLWVFTKLMLVDFGWDEIPHIYPIGALLAVMFSNKLETEFSRVETLEHQAARGGRPAAQLAVVVASSVAIAFAAIFPLLYLLTYADRSQLSP